MKYILVSIMFILFSLVLCSCGKNDNSSAVQEATIKFGTLYNIDLEGDMIDFKSAVQHEGASGQPVFDNIKENNEITTPIVDKGTEETARKLTERLLDRYKGSSEANEKISDYKIHKVDIIKLTEKGAVFAVQYTVKTVNPHSRWDVNIAEDCWVIGKMLYASLIKENREYRLNIIGPNAIIYYDSTEKPGDTEIASKLFAKNYLEPNLLHDKKNGERLLNYKIESVNKIFREDTEKSIFLIKYSVQGIEGETCWDAGSGEIGEKGWVINKSIPFEIIRHGNFYEGIIRGF